MTNNVTKRQKILYVVEAMGGGVFTYIVDLSNELVDTYDIYIAYAVRSQTPQNYQEYFDERVHLIKVENFTRAVNPRKDMNAFFEIKKIAKKIKPDIIHLHSSKAGALGRWAFNGKKVPLYYTPHGYSFLMENQSSIKRNIYRMIEVICAKRRCKTVSCGWGEYQETLKFNVNATYIDNGINVVQLESDLQGIQKKAGIFTVFTLGRISYQKNPKMFNEIAKALPDIRFLWIGDGDLKNELTANNIEVTGWVNRKEALRKAQQADVFLLTSLWEGLPISLLEAMYMKKACVVSNVIGNKDVIHTGVNGFVCDEKTEFVSAIIQCKDGKADNMIKQAFDDINKRYNTKVMAEKYKVMYQK